MSSLHAGIDYSDGLWVKTVDVGAVRLGGVVGGLPNQRKALVERGRPELVNLDPEDARRAADAGATLLAKPVKPAALKAFLSRLAL